VAEASHVELQYFLVVSSEAIASISVPSTSTVTYSLTQVRSSPDFEFKPVNKNTRLSSFTESDLDGFNVNLATVTSLASKATVFLANVALSEIVRDPLTTNLNVVNAALFFPAGVQFLSSPLRYKSKSILLEELVLFGCITALTSTLTDFPAST
jgi:hypothetical protein